MPNPSLSAKEIAERQTCYEQCVADGFAALGERSAKGSAVEEAVRRLGLSSHQAIRIALKKRSPSTPDVTLPEFPDDDLPVDELIALQTKRFQKRHAYHKSKRWFPVKINMEGPIGLSFFGDPHTDDNGCNWPLLRRDCDIHAKTPGLFGLNVGDTTNNWVGRLMHLASRQDASQQTARKFAKWLLSDSGVTWLCWVIGNHDSWNEGDAILRAMGGHMVPMEDWQAQFTLMFPNGKECRIWCAHDFPGNSQWNSLHGPQKAAHTKDWAHVYACGHKHNWAMHNEESASKEFVYWLIRARGYKFMDDYAEKLGHADQQEGASITAVINPDAKCGTGFVQCFADMEAAADYLTYLRKRGGYAKAKR